MECTWKTNSPYNLETSYEIIPIREETEMEWTIGIEGETGWFTCYVEEENDEFGGGLWFEGKELQGYDGVFELPSEVIIKLEELGYDCSYAKD